MSIIINDVSYIHPDREVLFQHVSFSVGKGDKAALIGPNGSGKSTLLHILSGELKPVSGEVSASEKPYYIPQHFGQYNELTIAEALGISGKLAALQAILSGDLSEIHYTVLNDDWTIEERALSVLSAWGLSGFALTQPMATLSGGEKTRVFLSGAVIHEPGIILLDEPSNHLDAGAREQLYAFIRSTAAAVVVVSHDRTLLNQLDTIYELSAEGVTAYGGNYEFYKEQKEGAIRALRDQVHEKEKVIRQARRTAQEAAERKQRMDSRGEQKQKKEGMARIMMNTMRNRAEGSASRLKDVHAEKVGELSDELRETRGKIPDDRALKVKFDDSRLHRGKIMVTAKAVNYRYADAWVWPEPLSFQILSGERIVIKGGNGSGKTTLIRLILGELEPMEGELFRADFQSLYMDQEYSLVDNSLTVFEQVERYNTRHLPEHELKTELHRFLFPAETWDKQCGKLSGGEKMKLIFCCLLIGNATPDVFVLDEPTNNLDIKSMEIVTNALQRYKGTLLVISHDRYFVEEIGIERAIELGD